VVVHTFNHSYSGGQRLEGSQFEASLGKKIMRPPHHLYQQARCGPACLWSQSHGRPLVGGLKFEASHRQTYLKQKRAMDVVQGIEHLPSKCEALSSTPASHKKSKIQSSYKRYNFGPKTQYVKDKMVRKDISCKQ
jgi:hypothetical protein